MPILAMEDAQFLPYGRILTDMDFSQLAAYVEANTPIPEAGNIYVPSDAQAEQLPVCQQVQESIYGGMDIQVGYCNGRNSTYNGFEYHKGSEINIAITDLIMVLGHSYHIQDNTYENAKAQVFFVKAGTAFELYQTSLHLSPCKVTGEGFKAVVILPKGTNTPLDYPHPNNTKEDQLLLLQNKWIIAHKDREPLVKMGAHVGIIGENTEIQYE